MRMSYRRFIAVLVVLAVAGGWGVHQALESRKPRVAIVIDDVGYTDRSVAAVRHLPRPVTFSILPNLPHSTAMAQAAQQRGHEVIIHLPMEPHEPVSKEAALHLEQYTVLAAMHATEVEEILARATASVPYAKGLSNHMGSKATENRRVMRELLRALKARRMFFLDSVVTTRSMGERVAKEVGLPFARRSVFLDNEERPDYIAHQLRLVAAEARVRGSAIGIGHDRTLTYQTLQQVMPELRKEGIRFVRVSQLTKQVP
ncbi:MAG: divergent polysaccharide deacetylase family protein [Candidatus Omnitrophica bacterium]|nr:divergent polysaccharide deacetylase family protein [Candidatus Omnitrophota bacterium]